MRVQHLTVHWHQDTSPIYGAEFQPRGDRIATCGGDKNVRMWRLPIKGNTTEVEFLATLSFHEQAVNTVSWNSQGDTLASGGDDGVVCFWQEDPMGPSGNLVSSDDVELWKAKRRTRGGGGEIYDLAWSPSGRYIASAAMDNCVRIYDAATGDTIHTLGQHGHYVQGIAWDPLGGFLASESADRSMIIYRLEEKNTQLSIKGSPNRIVKSDLPDDRILLFHNESFGSFFRRLTFSPDGSLLVAPAGQVKSTSTSDLKFAIFVYARRSRFNRVEAILPQSKQGLCVRFSPQLWSLKGDVVQPRIRLPYRMIYAVVLQNAVAIYDTEHESALCHVSNLHYSALTDLAWTTDGRRLFVTSIDGYCSILEFERGDLGEPYTGTLAPTLAAPASANESSSLNTSDQTSQVQQQESNQSEVHILVPRKKRVAA